MDSLENWCKKFSLGDRLRRIEMKGKVSNSEAKKLMSESQVQIHQDFPSKKIMKG